MTNSLIHIRNLVKYYDDGLVKALNGIDLDINQGDFISIIGPSGSGKSTLLHMLGALDKPSSGEIIVDGVNLNTDEDLTDFRFEKIGFVFQLHNLIPNLSVFENIQIPLVCSNVSEAETEERALKLIKAVGLEDKRDKKPTKLSGGERQRVAIARALMNNPSIILADEPTGALDSSTGEIILDLLKELHDTYGVTLIIVTHDNEVASLADRTIKIKDGKIIEDILN